MNQAIVDLQTEVAETKGIMESATVFVQGVPALVQAARDAALAEGASPEVLAILDGLKTDLDTASSGLQAAIAANP